MTRDLLGAPLRFAQMGVVDADHCARSMEA
jgi:hypothetical protein